MFEEDLKSFWKSKTVWFNAVMTFLVVLESQTGALQPLLPVNFYQMMVIILPIVNTYLRTITTKGLK